MTLRDWSEVLGTFSIFGWVAIALFYRHLYRRALAQRDAAAQLCLSALDDNKRLCDFLARNPNKGD